jgi:putative DNA-invertase from lambdoid prophage Rac
MMLGIFPSFAQFERDLISERTMAGLAAIKAHGTPLGRPSRVHRQQVALIRQLAAEGKPQRTIAALTALSRPVVQRVPRVRSRRWLRTNPPFLHRGG